MTTIITAQCVSCNAQREIDDAESRRLTREHAVPICEKCGMPMVAMRARIIDGKE